MDDKKVLLRMVKTLATDLQNIQQRGAGYYSVSPFVQKYNRLLEKAKEIFKKDSVLLEYLPGFLQKSIISLDERAGTIITCSPLLDILQIGGQGLDHSE